jgi:hypothetical protein
MYLPHLLAAWYSSAGMVRNLSVFIGGCPFGFPDVHPLWASISFTQGFSQNGRTIPRKFLNFGQKKSRQGGKMGDEVERT